MLVTPTALAPLRPNSRNASQQSTAKTDPEGPTRRANLIAVSPKPQPASITLSPSFTGKLGKIASLWRVRPSTRMCFPADEFWHQYVIPEFHVLALLTYFSRKSF